MRKLQKTQFMELLDTLCKACIELTKQSFGSGFVNLCADMQEFVSGSFDFLQSIAEGETKTGGLLAGFYERLYGVSQGNEKAESLLPLAKEIADCAKKELKPDRIEVAFFCYKASMSDCLESIYLAAKADPSCDAFFIPIPYYDRREDGSLGEFHYEGSEYYSEQYELGDWQTYDVEARRPDVIFIMNPYDECNLITSVHPYFYASRLKQFTNLLVYVPYFIHYEEIDKKTVPIPGVLLSDKTIVQSEHVREQYLESICAYFPSTRREDWERRIVALGSPKVDKVLHVQREKQSVLKEWEHLLEEGKEKKIILYNLSLEAALEFSGEKEKNAYLHKLRSVLEFFRSRKDVLLWWRPHPFLAQTFFSMRREFYQEYLDIVKEYRMDAFGIYDDTADLERAISFADACYGDHSSLNLLMQLAGKPVLIQNVSNAGRESKVSKSREQAEKAMKRFADRKHYEYHCSYLFGEGEDNMEDNFTLADFLDYLDVIEGWREEQVGKFRARYTNSDGTAGQKIYDYIKELSEEGSR